jgi:hypothetical protein
MTKASGLEKAKAERRRIQKEGKDNERRNNDCDGQEMRFEVRRQAKQEAVRAHLLKKPEREKEGQRSAMLSRRSVASGQ